MTINISLRLEFYSKCWTATQATKVYFAVLVGLKGVIGSIVKVLFQY